MKTDVWRSTSDIKDPWENKSSHSDTIGFMLKNSILSIAAQSNEHKQNVRNRAATWPETR